MKIQISALGMDMTPAVKTYATEKVKKLEKLVVQGHRDAAMFDVKLIAAESNTDATKDKCHITLSGLGQGHTLHVEAEEPDMHVAIDRAVHKLKEPLRRHEERYRDHLRRDATAAKRQAAESAMETGGDETA